MEVVEWRKGVHLQEVSVIGSSGCVPIKSIFKQQQGERLDIFRCWSGY